METRPGRRPHAAGGVGAGGVESRRGPGGRRARRATGGRPPPVGAAARSGGAGPAQAGAGRSRRPRSATLPSNERRARAERTGATKRLGLAERRREVVHARLPDDPVGPLGEDLELHREVPECLHHPEDGRVREALGGEHHVVDALEPRRGRGGAAPTEAGGRGPLGGRVPDVAHEPERRVDAAGEEGVEPLGLGAGPHEQRAPGPVAPAVRRTRATPAADGRRGEGQHERHAARRTRSGRKNSAEVIARNAADAPRARAGGRTGSGGAGRTRAPRRC
jgi:hypothetical protein